MTFEPTGDYKKDIEDVYSFSINERDGFVPASINEAKLKEALQKMLDSGLYS